MKNIALLLALVLVSLPAMGQDKEPVKKPQVAAVKKAAQQPGLDALRAKLKTAIADGKITKEEAKAIYAKAAAGQGKSKDGAKPKSIAKPAAKPGAKPIAKPGAKPIAKPGAKPTAKPGAKPIAKPGAKPTAKPGAKPIAKPGAKPIKVDLDALGAKLKGAVDAGKLTEKEAIAIYEKAEVGQGKSKEGAKSGKGELAEAYEEVAREVRAAIKAGKITQEQGKEKLAAFKKQLAQKAPAKDGAKKPAAAGSDLLELFQLVEKGELTAEEAIKKYKTAGVKKEFPAKKELPKKK